MKPALLCQTVTGRTMADLVAAREGVRRADIVELRLDGVEDLDVEAALAGRRLPAIVTCRPVWEGGRFAGSEEARKRILSAALEAGAEYVDIEWKAGFDDLVTAHAPRIVLSSHDFTGVPADLSQRARAMRQTGAGTIKLAVMAHRLSDTLPLLEIGAAGNAVVVGMGAAGTPSRLLAARFGSRWSYAGSALAPGQLPVDRMIDEFRFQAITSRAAIYGVVGNNVPHSLSPAMHNAAFADAGLDAVYVPLPAADFDDFLGFASAVGLVGASVTIPFKLDALRAASVADDLASAVGAANTLRHVRDGWEATNTDVAGFLEPLERTYPGPLRDVRAAVLGAGGVARAVVVALSGLGARVTVHARREAQALDAAGTSSAAVAAWPPLPGSWDLLVNCTPLGGASAPDESPLPGGPFDGRCVYDLTYGPRPSLLVREAREAGCLTLDGLPMLVAQAERQFETWIGRRPGPGVMAAAARARVDALSMPAASQGQPEQSLAER
jgi:3-dehydroquinate dehydratase/shikimate dehydrogenase